MGRGGDDGFGDTGVWTSQPENLRLKKWVCLMGDEGVGRYLGHALRAESKWGGVRLMVAKSSVGHVDDMLTAHGCVETVWAGVVIFSKDVANRVGAVVVSFMPREVRIVGRKWRWHGGDSGRHHSALVQDE